VAHDDFRRVAIEPKKTETGSDQGGTNDRQLTGVRIERDLEIFRDAKISAGVTKERIGESAGNRAADGKAVEAVGQVHRVRRPDDDKRKKEEGEPAHVRNDGHLEERHVKRTRLDFDERIREENRADDEREGDLKNQFEPATDAVRFLFGHLQIVIVETE